MNASKEFVINMASRESSEEVRKRTTETPSWAPGGPDYDPNLPYGPKVYLARRKKPDPCSVTQRSGRDGTKDGCEGDYLSC
ncbi:hypothetical protein QZH41_000098 [Actinostola sp. cb2023]|nr:hypothetical protein QZH41_000098 [Actinostola sp. cb2023]